ncbi:S-layer homology domain-containing protein, partial [Ellagibacter isourolithinifaciens]|uniref:S-layer homology domain-containing protein n=1 Tax=Ellagibacter isourolithinifaciens TaxID=2137581 RepID=UPI003A8CAA53
MLIILSCLLSRLQPATTKLANCGGRHVAHQSAQMLLSDAFTFSVAETMQPNREITREELAVVMMRYAKSCGIAGADAEPSEEGITDWADVSSFAMSSIKWALANGVISGVDNLDGTRSLCPHDSASRAQMAKIILNVEAMRG